MKKWLTKHIKRVVEKIAEEFRTTAPYSVLADNDNTLTSTQEVSALNRFANDMADVFDWCFIIPSKGEIHPEEYKRFVGELRKGLSNIPERAKQNIISSSKAGPDNESGWLAYNMLLCFDYEKLRSCFPKMSEKVYCFDGQIFNQSFNISEVVYKYFFSRDHQASSHFGRMVAGAKMFETNKDSWLNPDNTPLDVLKYIASFVEGNNNAFFFEGAYEGRKSAVAKIMQERKTKPPIQSLQQ